MNWKLVLKDMSPAIYNGYFNGVKWERCFPKISVNKQTNDGDGVTIITFEKTVFVNSFIVVQSMLDPMITKLDSKEFDKIRLHRSWHKFCIMRFEYKVCMIINGAFLTKWRVWAGNLQKIDEEKKRQEKGGDEEVGTSSAANIKKCSVCQQIGHNKKNMHC